MPYHLSDLEEYKSSANDLLSLIVLIFRCLLIQSRKCLYLILFLIAPIYAGVLLPTKPSIDPFYNAPEGFKNATVGDILQFRKTPKSITGGFVPLNVQNSWQF